MIHAENQNVTFDEGERRKITCAVNGGYPKPEVKVLVGSGEDEKDITSIFTRNDQLVKVGSLENFCHRTLAIAWVLMQLKKPRISCQIRR